MGEVWYACPVLWRNVRHKTPNLSPQMLDDRDYMRARSGGGPLGLLKGFNAFWAIMLLNSIVFVTQFVFETGWATDPATGKPIYPLGGVSLDALLRGQVWTLLTYMFVHGSLWHFVANMLLIGFAGQRLHALVGNRHYAQIYFFSGLVGAAVEMVIGAYFRQETGVPLLGASAAGFGVLMALAVMLPDETVTALIYFIIPLQLRLWNLALGLLLVNVVFGVLGLLIASDAEWMRVAYFAHIGGGLTGWYYMRMFGYGGRPMTYERLWRNQHGHDEGQRREREYVRARRQLVVDIDHDAAQMRMREQHDVVVDLMKDEIDPILDKISEQGINSLTDDERRILERASREIERHTKGRRH